MLPRPRSVLRPTGQGKWPPGAGQARYFADPKSQATGLSWGREGPRWHLVGTSERSQIRTNR